MQRNTCHGDLACDAWSLGKWSPTFRRKVEGPKPSERKAIRCFETSKTTKRRSNTPQKTIFLNYTTVKIKKKKLRSNFVSSSGSLWRRGFAVSRHVAWREISRNAGAVHCYCSMNLGWCLYAFYVHGVRIIEKCCLSFCPSQCLSAMSLGLHKLNIGVAVLKSCREFNFGSYYSLQIPERPTSIILRQYYK